MVVGFCFNGGWCYSGWWLWDLRTLALFYRSEMSPGLFQDFMDRCIKCYNSLIISWTTDSLTAASQSGETQVRILWVANFWFPFYEIRAENQRRHKFIQEILFGDSSTGCPSLITLRIEYLFTFQFLYCEPCVKNWWGKLGKH